jgi:dTDP-4-amino-4,6-dideoxygalactose transaminase
MLIPINKPIINKEEEKAVLDVLKSGELTDSSYKGGRYTREFESKMRSILRCKHVIAVNSGTAALHCALLAVGVKQGDEVIVPSFTFVATANAVLACGAKPVFVDIGEDYNIDVNQIKKAITRKTKAIIPVHLYGYPADMDQVREIASKNDLFVIEDAAESLGAEYRGKQTGTLSDAGCFSFYASKVVTSGEGGAVATNNDEIADKVRMIRNHGMVEGYDSRTFGLNYRLPEVSAAIGSVQLDKLQSHIDKRRKNAVYLNERICDKGNVKFTQNSKDRTHVFYLYTVSVGEDRDKLLHGLREKGIGASVYFKIPVHKTPLYYSLGYGSKKLPKTESAAREVISLPVHPGLSEKELDYIASEFIKQLRKSSK